MFFQVIILIKCGIVMLFEEISLLEARSMRVSMFCSIIFPLLCYSFVAKASDISLPKHGMVPVIFDPIPLKIALIQARTQQPQMLIAQASYLQARSTVLNAITPFLPSLNFSVKTDEFVNKSSTSGLSVIGSSVIGGQGTRYSNYATVTSSWNLFSGGKDLDNYAGAKAGVRAADADLNDQENKTLLSVLTAYNDLLKAQLTVVQLKRATQLQQQIAQRAEDRFIRGMDTLLTVNRARMTWAQEERTLLQAQQDRNDKASALAQAIGMRLTTGHLLQANSALPRAPRPSTQDFEQAVQADPSVKAAKERITVAERKLAQAQDAFYPSISFTARYDWLGQNFQSVDRAVNATSPNSFRIGLSLQQSLLPFTSEISAIDSAQADLIKAQANYQQALITVETQLRSALNQAAANLQELQSAHQSAKQARQVLHLSTALFHQGRTTLDTVDQADMQADQEAATARSLALDEQLQAWTVYRILHPTQFANALLRAVGAKEPK